jgi:hypothetical protein
VFCGNLIGIKSIFNDISLPTYDLTGGPQYTLIPAFPQNFKEQKF